jgi:pimeloyl-ACP methyl ester carboxylesterase
VITPRTRRRLGFGALAAGVGALAGYVGQRRMSDRWRADQAGLEAVSLVLDDRLVHRHIPVSDGGSIHVVETGAGPPIDQRGHGPSAAGTDGYGLDRLSEDVIEVLGALDVTGAVLVGHSLGGMVTMTAAINSRDRLAAHVTGIALVATSSHPLAGVPVPPSVIGRLSARGERSLARAERRGHPAIRGSSMLTWSMRVAYGSRPDPTAIELGRIMMTAMSPASLGSLLRGIGSFKLKDHLGTIDLPTRVVVGTRDVLTPPRHAKAMAEGIPHAELVVLPGTGHMVMLECPEELNTMLHEFSVVVTKGRPT